MTSPLTDAVFGEPNLSALDALASLFSGLDADVAKRVNGALYAALVAGANPQAVVAQLVDALSPARALTIARTELLRAYNGAALASYRANRDVVAQWMWVASAGACIACVEMDGTVHDLDEDLDDHPLGRCTRAPVTKSWDDILGPLGLDASDLPDTRITADYQGSGQTGADWFAQQSADVQRALLGPAAYTAWQRGDLNVADLLDTSGGTVQQASLKSLGLDASDYL